MPALETSSLRQVLLLVVACIVLLTGCRTDEPRSVAAPIAEETSVKPGINAEYLKPDLNVTNWVERFEREGREIYEHRNAIVAAAKVKPGSAIADIGCGTGLFTPLLAAATGPSGRVYAVDIVPVFLSLVKQRAAESGLNQIQTVLGAERAVNLPADSVDLAFICDVYHHFEYPQQSLASLHRALRKRGEIFLIDFKREPGVSSDWVLNHVRAGQGEVTAEVEAAGFVKVEEIPLLKDNYVLRFRKRDR
jgi:SAM-dependent methyltransferase